MGGRPVEENDHFADLGAGFLGVDCAGAGDAGFVVEVVAGSVVQTLL